MKKLGPYQTSLAFSLVFLSACSFRMSGGEFNNPSSRKSSASTAGSTGESGGYSTSSEAPSPGALPTGGSETPSASETETPEASGSTSSTEEVTEEEEVVIADPGDDMTEEEREALEEIMEALRTTPPVTTVSLANGIYTGTQTVTLQCTSLAGASACASLSYQLSHSGGSPATAEVILDSAPSVSLTLDHSGTYTLVVFSRDAYGSTEEAQTYVYDLDLEDPVLTLTYSGAPFVSGTSSHSAFDIDVTCTDVTSSCPSFAYTFDGSEPDFTGASASTRTGVPGTDRIRVGETTGSYRLKVRARDSAGRVSATQEYTASLQLPCSSPSISASGYETSGACTRTCGTQTWELPLTTADRTECVCMSSHTWRDLSGSREVGMCQPSARVYWILSL